jgi:SAM-dependent methyltransferase
VTGSARFHLRVQRYGWDLAADSYQDAWVPLLAPYADGCVERAAIRPGARVLDLATGTGTAALRVAERTGPAGEVVGTDISDKMVAAAAARAAAAGLGQAAAIAEAARVLRPGGRLAVAVWGRRAACGWREVFPIVGARVSSEVCPLFFALGVPGALAAALAAGGLAAAREEREQAVLRWADDDAACEAIFVGGPVALAYAKMAPELRAEARREYLASIAAYRGPAGYQVPVELVYGVAVKPAE